MHLDQTYSPHLVADLLNAKLWAAGQHHSAPVWFLPWSSSVQLKLFGFYLGKWSTHNKGKDFVKMNGTSCVFLHKCYRCDAVSQANLPASSWVLLTNTQRTKSTQKHHPNGSPFRRKNKTKHNMCSYINWYLLTPLDGTFGKLFPLFLINALLLLTPIMNPSAKQEKKLFYHLIGRYGDSWLVGKKSPSPLTLYKYLQQVTETSKCIVFQDLLLLHFNLKSLMSTEPPILFDLDFHNAPYLFYFYYVV